MAWTNRSPSVSSLFVPLHHEDILVKDEKILYCERRHWASLLLTASETLAILFLVLISVGSPIPPGVLGILTVFGSIYLIYRMIQAREWRNWVLWTTLVIFIVLISEFGLSSIILGIVLCATIRFLNKFILWAFYERLYITNRRIIGSGGFLGSTIAVMPLSRITDISLGRSLLAEIFGYAEFHVETAGQEQALAKINFLNKPGTFYDIIIELSTPVSELSNDEEEIEIIDPWGVEEAEDIYIEEEPTEIHIR